MCEDPGWALTGRSREVAPLRTDVGGDDTQSASKRIIKRLRGKPFASFRTIYAWLVKWHFTTR